MTDFERLRTALMAHASGETDNEGRTPLVDLLLDLADENEDQPKWSSLLSRLIFEQFLVDSEWWEAIDFLVAEASLESDCLGEALERVLAGHPEVVPRARATIYSLLARCGRPVGADFIWRDLELRQMEPVAWLDLMMPMIPDIETRRKLLLNEIAGGRFSVADLQIRIDEIRKLGGQTLGDWLIKVRDAFSLDERAEFDECLQASGLDVSRTELVNETRRSPSLPLSAFLSTLGGANYDTIPPSPTGHS